MVGWVGLEAELNEHKQVQREPVLLSEIMNILDHYANKGEEHRFCISAEALQDACNSSKRCIEKVVRELSLYYDSGTKMYYRVQKTELLKFSTSKQEAREPKWFDEHQLCYQNRSNTPIAIPSHSGGIRNVAPGESFFGPSFYNQYLSSGLLFYYSSRDEGPTFEPDHEMPVLRPEIELASRHVRKVDVSSWVAPRIQSFLKEAWRRLLNKQHKVVAQQHSNAFIVMVKNVQQKEAVDARFAKVKSHEDAQGAKIASMIEWNERNSANAAVYS